MNKLSPGILLLIVLTLLASCHPQGFVTLGTNYESNELVVSDFAFWKAPVGTYWSFSASVQVKVDAYINVRMITIGNFERGSARTHLSKGEVYNALITLLRGTDSLFRFEVYLYHDNSYTTPTDSFSLDFRIDMNSINKIRNVNGQAYRQVTQEKRCIITGKVIDKKNGKPLPSCNVLVVGTHLGGVTNAEGNYEIHNLSPGSHKLQFLCIGYKNLEISILFGPNDNPTNVNVALEEAQVDLR